MSEVKHYRTSMPDESGWCVLVKDNIYKSTVHHLGAIPLAFPKDIDMAPIHKNLPGFPGPENNGKSYRLLWGMLFRGEEDSRGCIWPKAIVGYDDSPLADATELHPALACLSF